MRQDVFSQNTARDRPEVPDKEKLKLKTKRKSVGKVRTESGIQDSAFQQADKKDGFAGKRAAFSEVAEHTDPRQGRKRNLRMQENRDTDDRLTVQKKRIRQNYAKDVREDLGMETGTGSEMSPPGTSQRGRSGRKQAFAEGRHTGDSSGRESPFQVEKTAGEKGLFYSDASQGKSSPFLEDKRSIKNNRWSSRKRTASRNVRSTMDAGTEGVRQTVNDSVLPEEESDSVAAKTARGSYGATRLAGEGLEDVVKGIKKGGGNAAGTGFSAEHSGSFSVNTAKAARAATFYNMEEGRAASLAARQKAAKEFQKHLIRKNYQTGRGGLYIPIISRIRERARTRSSYILFQGGKSAARQIALFLERHPMILIILFLSGVLLTLFGAAIYGGSSLLTNSVAPSSLATTFTAEDEDILAAEDDYRAMETDLNRRIMDLRNQYPGYENYGLNAGQVGHNPFQLAALLTVLHENYTEEDVQESLQKIFELQYNFSMHDEAGAVSTKTVRVGQSLGSVVTSGYCACEICCGQWAGGPTASGVMPTANHTIAVDAYTPTVPMGTKVVMNGIEYTVEDTGAFAGYGVDFDVYYSDHNAALQHGHQTWEAYIADDNGSQEVEVLVSSGSQQFTAVLANNGIDRVAQQLLNADEMERYNLLVETKGNKPDLFPTNIYANTGSGRLDYTFAGDALSDQKFANMMAEAMKYLDYPYVWGGSSPATSFDCSGYVCWVINNCGNGWNVGRTTADGLCNMLARVSYADAKPGDIIFFAGTYDTVGASHVGIYLGNNMMLHCGEPIQYTDISGAYWQQHLYAFGRLP